MFYSYKGGVGRSFDLCVQAHILAAAGSRVLIMDLDLEAPGMQEKLAVRGATDVSRGALELFVGGNPFELLAECIDVSARIALLPAGPRPGTKEYFERYIRIDWTRVRENARDVQGLLAEFQMLASMEYDYLLIDARTGLCDSSGIALSLINASIVACCTYSRESIEGMFRLLALVPSGERSSLAVAVSRIPVRAENSAASLARDALSASSKPMLTEDAESSIPSQVRAFAIECGIVEGAVLPVSLLREDDLASTDERRFFQEFEALSRGVTKDFRGSTLDHLALTVAVAGSESITPILLQLLGQKVSSNRPEVVRAVVRDLTSVSWWLDLVRDGNRDFGALVPVLAEVFAFRSELDLTLDLLATDWTADIGPRAADIDPRVETLKDLIATEVAEDWRQLALRRLCEAIQGSPGLAGLPAHSRRYIVDWIIDSGDNEFETAIRLFSDDFGISTARWIVTSWALQADPLKSYERYANNLDSALRMTVSSLVPVSGIAQELSRLGSLGRVNQLRPVVLNALRSGLPSGLVKTVLFDPGPNRLAAAALLRRESSHSYRSLVELAHALALDIDSNEVDEFFASIATSEENTL